MLSKIRLFIALGALAASSLAQVTWHVDADAVPPGSGRAGSPFTSIQSGIDAASSGDQVLVGPGSYLETVDFVGKEIAVRSAMGPTATTIDGDSGGTVVSLISGEGPQTLLEGFTITGGDGFGVGPGGIRCQAFSQATIRDCVIRNNIGVSGGGVGVQDADLVVDSCVIQSNVAGNGGGLFGISSALTVTGSIIEWNVASDGGFPGDGGGIYSDSGSLSVSDSDVRDNVAAGFGGGIRALQSALTLSGSRIERNSAGLEGAGIHFDGGGLACEVRRCAIRHHAGQGLVILAPELPAFVEETYLTDNELGLVADDEVVLTNTTVAGNTVGIDSSTLYIYNSIIWGNGSDFAPAGVSWWSHFNEHSIVPPIMAGFGFNSLAADPLFVDPSAGDFHVSAGSPAVDAGEVFFAVVGEVDQDGTPRTAGSNADIGADEVPDSLLPGSGEDLGLGTWLNDLGDPHASPKQAAIGDVLKVRLTSPAGGLVGVPSILLAQLFTLPPSSPIGVPEIHVSLLASFIAWGIVPTGTFGTPGLSPEGPTLHYLIPFGLSGFTLRLQGIALTPTAANGFAATTRALDIGF